MQIFTQFFLLALALCTVTQWWLGYRQRRHVAAHRKQVPQAFAAQIELADHQIAADYTMAKSKLGRWDLLFSTLILLAWTLGGGLNLLDSMIKPLDHGPIVTGTLVILAMIILSSLIDLPLAWYRTFHLEAQFGFNKTTTRVFWMDRIKGILIAFVLGTPLIAAILWLMHFAGKAWWIYAWALLTGFSLLLSWAYPTFIAPIFNKFERLDDDALNQRLEDLLSRTGFNSNGIFVMDGSKRSAHGNAYFSGFGRNKRIVFFDTLLKQLSHSQIEAVLAHELGHFKRKHIIKGMIVSFCMSLIGFAVLAWLMKQSWFYTGLGVDTASIYMALILFAIVSPVFTFFIGPVMAWFSRKHEFEADAFAAEQSSAGELIEALVGLYRENASTLTPDPLHSAFYDSHPPAAIRIAHLQQQ